LRDLQGIQHLGSLDDRARRGLRDRDANLDRIGGEGGVCKGKHTGGKGQQTGAMRTPDGFVTHDDSP
jgi:hypothetical protein